MQNIALIGYPGFAFPAPDGIRDLPVFKVSH